MSVLGMRYGPPPAADSDALHLLLIRHGPTSWNEERRYQGHSDTELSPEGRRRCERLRGRLGDPSVDRIVASDLRRARQSAGIVFPDREIESDPRLRELHFGAFEGRTYDECLHAYGDPFRAWVEDPANHDPPGGESLADLRARVETFLDDLPSTGRIAVVAHSGTIRTALAVALGLGYDSAVRFRISGASVSRLARFGREWVVEGVNG